MRMRAELGALSGNDVVRRSVISRHSLVEQLDIVRQRLHAVHQVCSGATGVYVIPVQA